MLVMLHIIAPLPALLALKALESSVGMHGLNGLGLDIGLSQSIKYVVSERSSMLNARLSINLIVSASFRDKDNPLQ